MCSWRNTKRVLQQGLRYENGTKRINRRKSCTKGWKWAPRISSRVRNEIRRLFENYTWTSLSEIAPEKNVDHATVWNILDRDLILFPYMLHMSTALAEDYVRSRLRFFRYCRQQLGIHDKYLERIVFSDEWKFSLPGQVNKQNCLIW